MDARNTRDILYIFILSAINIVSSSSSMAEVNSGHPLLFPRRIWAACDFEERRQDIAWFGDKETGNILTYPGNTTACGCVKTSGSTTLVSAVKPSIPPRMNSSNGIYFRYYCDSVETLTVDIVTQTHGIRSFSLRPINRTWSEAWTEITIEKNGNSGDDIRLDELRFSASFDENTGKPLCIIDDVICFSNDSSLPLVSDEPFPRRVIGVWSFDEDDDYQPWTKEHYTIIDNDKRFRNRRGIAQAVKHPENNHQWIRLVVEPLESMGEHTKLRFDYYQKNAPMLQVMMFDATIQDNRSIRLGDPVSGTWTQAALDFSKDSTTSGGSGETFNPGNRIDDIFFFPGFDAPGKTEFLLDNIVLYDAGTEK